MQGVETAHLNASIEAVLKGYYDLGHSTVEEALRKTSTYGKKDTLGMDAGPEITICEELRRHDLGSVVITEEIGTKGNRLNEPSRPNDPQTFRTVFISDPTDRSNQLKEFLGNFSKKMKIADILENPKNRKKWEEKNGEPASISGATSSISCVRRGIPIFSVIVNYVTQELFVSCAAGNRVLKLDGGSREKIDLSYVQERGQILTFPGMGEEREMTQKFVTFLGDTGKIGYLENFLDSGFMGKDKMDECLHYGKPGGPSRVLYLSSLLPRENRIGFILANGEKIGEWIHWLSFVQYARSQDDESQPALVLFEVKQERPWTKDGVLMSTPPNYSVFRQYGDKLYIDTNWLLRMNNPSQYRSTLILAPHDNRWTMGYSHQSGYRLVRFD